MAALGGDDAAFVDWAWVTWAQHLADAGWGQQRSAAWAAAPATDYDVCGWVAATAGTQDVRTRARDVQMRADRTWPTPLFPLLPNPGSTENPTPCRVAAGSELELEPEPEVNPEVKPELDATRTVVVSRRVAKLVGPCAEFACGQRPWKDCYPMVQALFQADATPEAFREAQPWLVHLAKLHTKGRREEEADKICEVTRTFHGTRVKLVAMPVGAPLTLTALQATVRK